MYNPNSLPETPFRQDTAVDGTANTPSTTFGTDELRQWVHMTDSSPSIPAGSPSIGAPVQPQGSHTTTPQTIAPAMQSTALIKFCDTGLLYNVLRYLPPKDISSLAAVCSSFNTIISIYWRQRAGECSVTLFSKTELGRNEPPEETYEHCYPVVWDPSSADILEGRLLFQPECRYKYNLLRSFPSKLELHVPGFSRPYSWTITNRDLKEAEYETGIVAMVDRHGFNSFAFQSFPMTIYYRKSPGDTLTTLYAVNIDLTAIVSCIRKGLK